MDNKSRKLEVINEYPNFNKSTHQLLEFDSDFESGNLDLVAKRPNTKEEEYDMLIRLDSNSRSHQQWFYFSVTAKPGGASYKGKKVKFNILNFTKPHSLYQQGMKLMTWSNHLFKEQNIGWHRKGSDIVYSRGRLFRRYST